MLLPVDFSQQIAPGSFEHALCYLVDQELNLSGLRGRYRNDEQSASVTADAGYHSEDGLKALAADDINAYIPDTDYRKRDERYRGQAAHKVKPAPLWDKRPKEAKPTLFKPKDFCFDPEQKTCLCPAGKTLYGNGSNGTIHGYRAIKFQGAKQDYKPCLLRAQCLKH